MSAGDLQSHVDATPSGGTLRLEPPRAEVRGPVTLSKPITIEGQGCSIWADKGPVVVVRSSGVTLKELRIEIPGQGSKALGGREACALLVEGGAGGTFSDVTVMGNVEGLPTEEGEWSLPSAVRLKTLQSGVPHELKVRVYVPVACALESRVADLDVAPTHLEAGTHEVVLKLDALADGGRIFGSLEVRTLALCRRIRLSGSARASGPFDHVSGDVVHSPGNWDDLVGKSPEPPKPAEPGPPTPAVWRLPGTIDLQRIEAARPHEFVARVCVAEECEVRCSTASVELGPTRLPAGAHEVRLRVAPLRAGKQVSGRIEFRDSAGSRIVRIRGTAAAMGPFVRKDGDIVYQPVDWAALTRPRSEPPAAMAQAQPPLRAVADHVYRRWLGPIPTAAGRDDPP